MYTVRLFLERATGVEPVPPAWKAEALPLRYARVSVILPFEENAVKIKNLPTISDREEIFGNGLINHSQFLSWYKVALCPDQSISSDYSQSISSRKEPPDKQV